MLNRIVCSHTVLQSLPNFVWTCEVASTVRLDTVKQRFCRDLVLPVETCLLWQRDQNVADAVAIATDVVRYCCDTALREQLLQPSLVPALLLQTQFAEPDMELKAIVDISLAFHIWYRLSKVQISKHTLELWTVVLQTFVPYLAEDQLNTATVLQELAHLPAAHYMTAHDSNKDVANPCLQLLAFITGYGQVPPDTTLANYIKQMKVAPVSIQTTHKLKTSSKSRLYIMRLQQRFLVMKFATLLASIKQRASSVDTAIAALWIYIDQEVICDDKVLPQSSAPPASIPVQEAAVETELLNSSLLLVDVLIPLARQLSTQAVAHHQLSHCIDVLGQTPYRQPHYSIQSVLTVNNEMIRQGELMLLQCLGSSSKPVPCCRHVSC